MVQGIKAARCVLAELCKNSKTAAAAAAAVTESAHKQPRTLHAACKRLLKRTSKQLTFHSGVKRRCPKHSWMLLCTSDHVHARELNAGI
jgi:hypothetical protein